MLTNLSYPVSGVSPITVGGTGTSIKIFPAVPSSLPVNAGQPSAVGQFVNGPAALLIPANGSYEGQAFEVQASGSITFGASTSPTVNFGLFNGTSLTVANDGTAIVTLTSAIAGSASHTLPFEVRIRLQGDSVSGIVQIGTVEAYMNSVTMGSTTNTKLTGISFLSGASTGQNPIFNGNSAPAALSLIFGIGFTLSDAGNSASLMQYAIV